MMPAGDRNGNWAGETSAQQWAHHISIAHIMQCHQVPYQLSSDPEMH